MLALFVGSAHAQAASGPIAQDLPLQPQGPIILAVTCLVFLLLCRLLVRWPKAEPWLVATAFAGIAPVAIFLLWVQTGGQFDRAATPNWMYLTLLAIPPMWWATRSLAVFLGATTSRGEDRSFLTPLMFLLPLVGLLLAQVFRITHMGPGAPIAVAFGQLVVIGVWWFASTKKSIEAGLSTASENAAAFPAESSKPTSPKPLTQASLPHAVERPPQPTGGHSTTSPAPVIAEHRDRIFVSYRRADSADVTGRIYDRLVQRFGKEQVFKDVDSIPLGVDFREHLGGVVGRCNILLAVMGDQWLGPRGSDAPRRLDDAKDFVRIEIEAALQRNIPVIPILVRGAKVPEESDLPTSLVALSYRNGIAVRPDPDFHRDMDRLIAGLEAHLKRQP